MSELTLVPKDTLLIFVMATYGWSPTVVTFNLKGEGEMTDNAAGFEKYLDSLGSEIPSHTFQFSYLIFGLGNKTYEHFNEAARKVDRKLNEGGATLVGTRGEGDDDGA